MTKNKQKSFKREIIKRFMHDEAFEEFERQYKQARMINIGRSELVSLALKLGK